MINILYQLRNNYLDKMYDKNKKEKDEKEIRKSKWAK